MAGQKVTIKWEKTEIENVWQVFGYVDGDRKLKSKFRARDEKHLRGMLLHDYLHVILGIGFTVVNEAELKENSKLAVSELLAASKRVNRWVEKLQSGKNIEMKKVSK